MAFFQEPEPPRGVPLDVLPGIRRIVARNPSVMTYHGTNTYLIDGSDGLTVLDPGPNDPVHVDDILRAAGDARIARIILTHTHGDHYGAVATLHAATSAPVYAYRISGKPEFKADFGMDDGDAVAGLRAVFTPGHAADHLCFEYHVEGTGKILFSGDHVMSWSSSIVSPPDGDMLAYYRSLELLLARDDVLYLSGHGPALPEPRKLTAELLAHRQYRERTILHELEQQPWVIGALSAKLYAKTDLWLQKAAERNVLAHMLKLKAEGVAIELESHPVQNVAMHPDMITEVERETGDNVSKMARDAARRFAVHPDRARN
jgi:glyoxylase-like metal-dependent hydrolase (beta-lactamase superfamily II)